MLMAMESRRHLLDTDGLSREEIQELLDRAKYWKQQGKQKHALGAGRFAANLFYEPSTRTRVSFEVAEKRLGMETIQFNPDTSSGVKGETLQDTMKTLASIGVEIAVVRHAGVGVLAELAREDLGLSLVNAGEGNGGHPTQALLDLFTMQEHFGEVAGLRVAIIGDIHHSRVARSNVWALKTMGAEVVLSGPASMRDAQLEQHAPYVPVDEAVRQTDVVMMLRVQLERHRETIFTSADDYLRAYGLTGKRESMMQPHAIIMHPGPVNRGVEMEDRFVEHPRSLIFEQMANGVWIRMAVLERSLEKE
ncbi:aspartate carbamoyltransferase [Marinithermofilum abyssi]|uniref:Aspartate carbamoyltransferase n=1 Tax=Marinithermofilum abyssi TaxID=1571185 RepID=A0A8J2YEE4_9BACL|nr:aspartate carbamoyltransferase catalytic subunit [Marinithermofilum abyssi]GGE22344.1 aspartate carbamoyltransferase [Marinithermofilum abyssi]